MYVPSIESRAVSRKRHRFTTELRPNFLCIVGNFFAFLKSGEMRDKILDILRDLPKRNSLKYIDKI